MDPVQRIVGASVAAAERARRAGEGFRVPGELELAPPAAAPTASLAGLLVLQEAGEETVRDRAARRRGRDLLAALAALQRDLLAGGADPERLIRLAALAAAVPPAADPALREAMAAIVLRARVELARYGDG